ncbi:hypothetical protein HFP57_02170 [Parasphingopyxis algicola]|uniref:hypothetical protein n=1 Tax=Parasphingopyxis algicola TaxID=2026624 RepID=UPI0015A006D5|nr:hypothetical protein [Parasphingopyxis algicola]QLC23954.1 hypothetical protein HFP57_02170 [Parasphingopyxis algicola]
MTVRAPMTDIALDRALAASPDPVMPTDLADRIIAEATARPQRRTRVLFKGRRTRRVNGRRRMRRPIILGSIGGGLLAASAVAAALVSDGTLDLKRIAEPVIELFVAEPPRETAASVGNAQASAQLNVNETPTAEIDGAEPLIRSALGESRASQLRRAFALRRRLQDLAPRQPQTRPATQRPRLAQRRALEAARQQATAGGSATIARRIRANGWTEAPIAVQNDRLEAARQRSNPGLPISRDNISDAQRMRIIDTIRNRRSAEPASHLPAANLPATDRPTSIPAQQRPITATQSSGTEPPARLPMIIDNTPPGPEPVELPLTRPDLSNGDQPGTASARRNAMVERLRAAQAAQRARAAAQRRTTPPRRPRIPRRRR